MKKKNILFGWGEKKKNPPQKIIDKKKGVIRRKV